MMFLITFICLVISVHSQSVEETENATNSLNHSILLLNETRPHYNEPNTELSQTNLTDTNATQPQKSFTCTPLKGGVPVEIVNGTELIQLLVTDTNVTTRDTPGDCILVLFYAKFCPFSCLAAPHFNAMSRALPDVKFVAIDAMKHHVFNTQNGIVGVPTLMLFHNGRPAAKYNDTEYTLDLFTKFVYKYTGIKAEEKSYVTSADFSGPVPSTPEKETDYFLGLSWLFIVVCVVYYFGKSKWWKWVVEMVQNTWRESEAQHEHND